MIIFNPGLVPIPETRFIKSFDCNNSSTYEEYINQISLFLDGSFTLKLEYRKPIHSRKCEKDGRNNGFCDFQLDFLKICSIPPYGFNSLQPCILLRLNRVNVF